MSRNRTRPDAGWADYKTLPRGEAGRCLCRQCGKEVPKGRRTFCGADCIHEWKMRSSPPYVRAKVWKRDRGICLACGVDTDDLKAQASKLKGQERCDFLKSRGFPVDARSSGQFWQADHIIEVVNGGGECGLENFQTLCTPCHKAKTKRLAGELARARRLEREAMGQPLPATPE